MLPAINREYWRIKGANGMQYHHIERTWQQDREFPDRSGPLQGEGSLHGIGGFSMNSCPLARMRLGPPPPKTPPPPPDLPVGAPDVIKFYRDEFNKRDYQGAGEVSTRELQELMSALGRDLGAAAINVLVQQIDRDGSGSINFTEFLEGCYGIREPRPTDKPPLKPMEEMFKCMREAIQADDIKEMERRIEECTQKGFPQVLRNYKEPSSGLGIIHVAARSGSDRMVLLMVDRKANPNETCRGQETPLHFASQSTGRYRDKMVAALLAAGAKRLARTTSGYTAMHYLASEHQSSGFEHLSDPAVLERFRQHRRRDHYAHGYHQMVPIADIVRGERKSRRRKEEDEHLATAASHRSSKSRTREKSHDRVRLVELHHAQDDDFGLPRTRGGVGTAQTRGTSAATVASAGDDLNWLTRERVRLEHKTHGKVNYSDSDD